MAHQISFSVVVCTYNRCESLKKCLTSISNQTFKDFEIVIVDDHSDDGTTDLIKNFPFNGKTVRVHRNKKNMGISHSRNKAATLSVNDIIAFIDDDCIANQDWLLELAKPFSNQNVAVVGGLIKDPQPINIAMMAARGHYKRFNQEGPCDSLPGGAANLAVRKKFYLNHPVKNIALEDWELCQKAIDNGHLIYNCPKAVVLHEHYHDFKTLLRQRYRYGIGQTWFRKRYKPFPLNLKTMILIISLLSLPLILIWPLLLFVVTFILIILFFLILQKDIKKGEKTLTQAIVSFPFFIIISSAECYGRLIGLFKKPTQINFGKDQIKINNHNLISKL